MALLNAYNKLLERLLLDNNLASAVEHASRPAWFNERSCIDQIAALATYVEMQYQK